MSVFRPGLRAFCSCLLAFLASAGPALASCPGLVQGFQASVAHVLDAETLRLHDGSILRLAGVLAPQAEDVRAASAAWGPAVAAKADVEALVLGKSIVISFGLERRDRYGRHLGHVHLGEGAERRWLQGHLLAQGLARVVTRAEDRVCEQEMLNVEKAAREARLGLWKEAAYAVRQAKDLDALTASAGTFLIVEGRITDSRRSSAGVRVDFAQKGRFGLQAVLPPTFRTADRKGLKDRRVRLRGWLEERGGRPALDLTVAGTVEILDEGRPDRLPLEP